MLKIKILFLLLFILIQASSAQELEPVQGNLMTKWAADVTPENVWKEYPRPQMVRKEWVNLNGLWDFEISMETKNQPIRKYNRKIRVPFCVESALSGIKETVRGSQEMNYRRDFTIPEDWNEKRILLHFEAVDYYSKIWIDGKFAGEHKGGYDAFQFDITDFLDAGLNHEINLIVWDPTDSGTQPVGKQGLPESLQRTKYTATSGIWQTVWLEPVNPVSIHSLKIIPDVDQSSLTIDVQLKGRGLHHQIRIQALDNGREVASAVSIPGKPIILKMTNPKLWSPESPFLYDLKISLFNDDKPVDEVFSYFGMRKISMARDKAGFMRIHLNNKEIFQLGPLDQGYWPDGILAPPSDDALKYDIEYLKKIGCNMDRVHMKVQPERWYYHCDKLGILVWQDMVSPAKTVDRSEIGGGSEWQAESEIMMDQLFNHPSIIQWVVFNEAWGQYDTERLTDWTKSKDPSRLVTNASGWTDRNVGDIRDFHDYTYYPSIAWVPENYPRSMVLGEAGGFDLPLKEHLWNPELKIKENIDRAGDPVREAVFSTAVLEERYNRWVGHVSMLRNYGLNAVVYTQISDVEDEVNGWMTYDRQISKIPVKRLAEIHQKFFEPLISWKDVIPLSMDKPQKWQYSFSEPSSEWFKKGNTGNWLNGMAPFGVNQMSAPAINTNWEEQNLYLQKEFSLKSIPEELSLITYNSGISDVYINGEFVLQINNLRRKDTELKVSQVLLPEKAMKLLKKGDNHLAVKFKFSTAVKAFFYYDFGLKEY